MKKFIYLCIATMLCCVAYAHAAAPPPKAAPTYNTEMPLLAHSSFGLPSFVMTPAPLLRQSFAITNTSVAIIDISIAPVNGKTSEIIPAGNTLMPRALPPCSQPDHPVAAAQPIVANTQVPIVQKE